MTFVPKERDMGGIECTIQGLWRDCILYEVPIMSISTIVPLVKSLFFKDLLTVVNSQRGILHVRPYGLEYGWRARCA